MSDLERSDSGALTESPTLLPHGEAGGASELLVPHIREFLAAIA